MPNRLPDAWPVIEFLEGTGSLRTEDGSPVMEFLDGTLVLLSSVPPGPASMLLEDLLDLLELWSATLVELELLVPSTNVDGDSVLASLIIGCGQSGHACPGWPGDAAAMLPVAGGRRRAVHQPRGR